MRKIYRAAPIFLFVVVLSLLCNRGESPEEHVDHWVDPGWADPAWTSSPGDRAEGWAREDYWRRHQLIVHTTPDRAAAMFARLQGDRAMNETEFLGAPPGHLFRHQLGAPHNGIFYVSFVQHKRAAKGSLRDYASIFKDLKVIDRGTPSDRPYSEPVLRFVPDRWR
jgi:hypothetical protein